MSVLLRFVRISLSSGRASLVLLIGVCFASLWFVSFRMPLVAQQLSMESSVKERNTAPADIDGVQLAVAQSSATGTLFLGNSVRLFQGERRFTSASTTSPSTLTPPAKTNQGVNNNNNFQCDRWAVVTTISGPTEAIQRAAELPGWCTVVVADTKTPTDFVQQAQLKPESKMKFLSINEQQQWADNDGKAVAAFVNSIPYKHFARKNIGYLYAIQHGAEFLFDFDDDNILHTDKNNAAMDPVANTTHLQNVRVPVLETSVFNHHDLMNASVHESWARGFPLDQLKVKETRGKVGYVRDEVAMNEFGVLQYCAQGDPDIDAIHRLTKPLPMVFAEEKENGSPLVVPSHAYAPYNAQASIHTKDALWATFLPFSVPGRVSDIWRGYFAETLFRDLGLSVVFLPPLVRQDRNAHNYLADMQAELDLYFKVGKLLEFLDQEWRSTSNTVPERMEQLWIALYERGYIEIEDVRAVQLWLAALIEIGYSFPNIIHRTRNDD